MSEQKKGLEVVFAPGCFDDFEGTPEELQDLIAHIRQLAADGTILDQSNRLTDEEAEEIMQRVEQRQPRQ